MNRNVLKEKMKNGKVVIGTGINIPCPELVELAGFIGFDCVIIDAEHGSITEESCVSMVRAAEAVNISSLVRVPENHKETILRYLDTGVQGIHVPQVNTKEDAEKVVSASKYYPLGMRGLGSSRWADYGTTLPLNEYAQFANEENIIFCFIENIEGYKNLDKILGVNFDAVFIGINDLSQSMGSPGNLSHPEVEKVVDDIIKKSLKAKKIVGLPALQYEISKEYAKKGVRFFADNLFKIAKTAGKQRIEEFHSLI